MKKLISFFEIPASNFSRAVKFYEAIFGIEMTVMECDTEKMAFFMEEGTEQSVGAISFAEGFLPSERGVLIHFNCEDITATSTLVEQNRGKIVIPRTKIQAEDRGYFCVFTDSEGNNIGLYADK
ncbi:VOC family protein [Bacteroides sp.]